MGSQKRPPPLPESFFVHSDGSPVRPLTRERIQSEYERGFHAYLRYERAAALAAGCLAALAAVRLVRRRFRAVRRQQAGRG